MSNEKERRRANIAAAGAWLLLLLQGAVIGVGAILPGISGGVLCVVFGIYKPMMELLSHPVKSLPKYYKMFIPVAIGCAAGFWALSGLIADLAAKNAAAVTSLFIGMICGMFPSLFREAGSHGRSKGGAAALVLSTVVLLALFLMLKFANGIELRPSIGWYLFCGVLWGISLIVPGMSSSSLLIFMGLYYPLSEGISGLDAAVLLPFIVGMAATVLLLARAVDGLFRRHYGIAYNCIIGFVIASTIAILPYSFSGAGELLLCAALAAAGFLAAFFMDKISTRLGRKAQEIKEADRQT